MDRGSKISGETLEKIAHSLIESIRAIHAEGIIHRDIKPSNIIFDEVSGRTKLIDFGCADTFDQLMFKGRAGTELYQNPDFINSSAGDWYALSLCLTELSDHCADRRRVTHIKALCKIMSKGADPSTISGKKKE